MQDMILYEDDDLIVCHKKAGIPVQSARIEQKDMVSILNNYLAQRRGECNGDVSKCGIKKKQRNADQEVFVVHRLDQPVEGLVVFAKNKKAAAGLSKQITEGSMKKRYQAVVCVTKQGEKLLQGFGDHAHIRIDYLVKNGKTNKSEVVDQNYKEAKRAELSFQVLEQRSSDEMDYKKYALVSIDLKTGRHHQIRVQMSHAGLPLYGDQKYHKNWQDYVSREEEPENELLGYFGSAPTKKNPSLALCSVELQMKHPSTGKPMMFQTKPTTEAFQFFRV